MNWDAAHRRMKRGAKMARAEWAPHWHFRIFRGRLYRVDARAASMRVAVRSARLMGAVRYRDLNATDWQVWKWKEWWRKQDELLRSDESAE